MQLLTNLRRSFYPQNGWNAEIAMAWNWGFVYSRAFNKGVKENGLEVYIKTLR